MVTPVILTFNESDNIETTLASLQWAREVIIVDSGSSDNTVEIARQFRNVRIHVHPFETHGRQWTFAVTETDVETPYVLCLDADMRVTEAFVRELLDALSDETLSGAWLSFDYWLCGKELRGSLYPDQLRCFKPSDVKITQTGHTQVFKTKGPTCRVSSRVIHEDRKPMERTLRNQEKYAILEAERILSYARHSWKDKARIAGIFPILAGIAGYIRAGGPAAGKASVAYGLERILFESILARQLVAKQAHSVEPADV
jgi:glycosyltransferase involved in cell wall biosynthesis